MISTSDTCERNWNGSVKERFGKLPNKVIGIDEISIRKCHSVPDVVSDLLRGRPIWMPIWIWFGDENLFNADYAAVL